MSDGLPPALDVVPGERLTDPGWLGDRIAATGRYYRTPDRGVAATLWWYSSSFVLLGPTLHALALFGVATRIDPGQLRLQLTPYGPLGRVLSRDEPVDGGAEGLGRHLDAALSAVIDPLVEVAGVRPQRLWAIAVDSAANRLLNERRPDLAGPVAAASRWLRPAPRFVDVVPGPVDSAADSAVDSTVDSAVDSAVPAQRFVRRGSCCLIFRIPGESVCASCPRQRPEDRAERLAAQARYLRGLG
jgi:hypothetical protein